VRAGTAIGDAPAWGLCREKYGRGQLMVMHPHGVYVGRGAGGDS
jgi:hypothetical protein